MIPKAVMSAQRIASRLRLSPNPVARFCGLPFAVFYRLVSRGFYSMDVPVKVKIGRGTVVYHGVGLVVHSSVIIGSDCVIRQCTTIGERHIGGGVPTIGNKVNIGSNVVILGPVTLGDSSVVGAGSVVLHDVPSGATVAGVPAKVIRQNG